MYFGHSVICSLLRAIESANLINFCKKSSSRQVHANLWGNCDVATCQLLPLCQRVVSFSLYLALTFTTSFFVCLYLCVPTFLPLCPFCSAFYVFLDASLHLYKSVCPCVGRSVGRLFRPSVRPSVLRFFS